MQSNFISNYKIKREFYKNYWISIIVWSCLSFSLMKLLFVFSTSYLLSILFHGCIVFSFMVYYFFKEKFFLCIKCFLISYVCVSLISFILNYIYSLLILIENQREYNQIWALIITIGIIPATLIYFVVRNIKLFKK